VSILHGPFASPDYAEAAGALAFKVDAVTLSDAVYAESYLRAGLGVFAPATIGEVGLYALESSTLKLDEVVLRLLGEDVLYAGRNEDFADCVRKALEAPSP
jgi:hypothetical protein